jgi:hypothetical protein
MIWYSGITLVTIVRYFYDKRKLPESWQVVREANLIESSLLAYPLDCCHAACCLQYGSDVIMLTVRNVIQALFTEGYALR